MSFSETKKSPGAWLGKLYWIRVLLAICIGLVLLFYSLQRSMIYYPQQADADSLSTAAERLGFEPWILADETPAGWKRMEKEAVADIVIFHGNAGFALHRAGLVDILRGTDAGSRCNFYLFEYPGYGARPGKPSEAKFVTSAREALEDLRRSSGLPLVLLGESLGTGVASLVAGELRPPPAGLLLVTPFDSLVSVAALHYPWLPVRWILRDRYDSASALKNYDGPVVLLLAGGDEIVPPELGKKLAGALPGPKLVLTVEGSDHNGVVGLLRPADWDRALRFAMDGGNPE